MNSLAVDSWHLGQAWGKALASAKCLENYRGDSHTDTRGAAPSRNISTARRTMRRMSFKAMGAGSI